MSDKVSDYVVLPEGCRGLDVGCGSGALTNACAKKNPQASMVGLDCWWEVRFTGMQMKSLFQGAGEGLFCGGYIVNAGTVQ